MGDKHSLGWRQRIMPRALTGEVTAKNLCGEGVTLNCSSPVGFPSVSISPEERRVDWVKINL